LRDNISYRQVVRRRGGINNIEPEIFLKIAVVAILLFIGIAVLIGAWRWEQQTREMRAQLNSAQRAIQPTAFNVKELDGLPPPVAHYFRRILKDGQPIIAAATIKHTGTFSLSEKEDKWAPFTSTQRVVTHRPGFDWDARIRMGPGLKVYVHDSYIDGVGILHASLMGLYTLANVRGTPEVAQGELMRFLPEAAWYPTRLLPNQGVKWEAVDETSARATLSDGAVSVMLLFRFGKDELIASARAEARSRTVGNSAVPTPWEGRFWNYERRDGMLEPTDGEVAWLLPDGRKPYWRGRVESIQFEFAR
jgi:hypothetical protein